MLSGVSFLVVVRGLLVVVASLVAEHRRWGVHAPVLAARRLAQYCGVQASAAVAMGSVALRHVESSQTGRGTCVLCISRQILNHRTTREVPNFCSCSLVCTEVTVRMKSEIKTFFKWNEVWTASGMWSMLSKHLKILSWGIGNYRFRTVLIGIYKFSM